MQESRFFDDPRNFLHSIDVDADVAHFVRTDPDLLRKASFVDGREQFALSEPTAVSLSSSLPVRTSDENVDRFLFNCSFCGSTYLSRLLDMPGRSLVLKEPRSLTEIAGWKVHSLSEGKPINRLGSIARFAKEMLRRRFASTEPVTIKVANQGNALLDIIADDPATVRPVFITISRLDFLRAVFRGGVDRMHHASTIAWSVAKDTPDGEALLRDAVKAGRDPVRKAANLAVLARFLQVCAFRRTARRGGWTAKNVVDYRAITHMPEETANKVAKALNLPIEAADIARNLVTLSRRHAKLTTEAFTVAGQDRIDNRLHAEHGRVFDDALDWAERTLGPQVEVIDSSLS